MTKKIRPKDNAGVQGATGYEFQKNCALYLLLDDYENLKNKNYYIYFEHFDDFVFCFINGNSLEVAHLYQAKKSSKQWTLASLKDITNTMCEDGVIARNDCSFNKIPEYSQQLYFISNNIIELEATTTNESKELNCFEELCSEAKVGLINHLKKCKKRITYLAHTQPKGPSKVTEAIIDKWYKSLIDEQKEIVDNQINNDPILIEVTNLIFRFVDLGRTNAAQKERLIGKFAMIFNDRVAKPAAAIDTLLLIFNERVTTFNQGCVTFANRSKRVSSSQINDIFHIISSKSMAFEEWRSKKTEIARNLKLPISEHRKFETVFENSFDYFKDLTQAEHQKIFTFSAEIISTRTDIYDVCEFVNITTREYNLKCSTKLSCTELKAIIYAAYFEITNHKDNE